MLTSAPNAASGASIDGGNTMLGPPGPLLTVIPHERDTLLPSGRAAKWWCFLSRTWRIEVTCASRSIVLWMVEAITQPLSALLRAEAKGSASPIRHISCGVTPSRCVMWSGSQVNPVMTKRAEISFVLGMFCMDGIRLLTSCKCYNRSALHHFDDPLYVSVRYLHCDIYRDPIEQLVVPQRLP